MSKTSSIDEVKRQMLLLFSECSEMTGSGAEFESLVEYIVKEYGKNKIKEYCDTYLLDCENLLAKDKLMANLLAVDSLIHKDSWKQSILDLNKLRAQEIPGPLIQRGDDGLIYRNDVHMISGAPGAMKSKFAMCIAATALNGGLEAERTLGMYATNNDIRVAFVDTELGADTIKRRLPIMEALCGRVMYDQNRFIYISLRRFTKEERLHQIYSLIKKGGFDLIIIDGLRDISNDFNDARESADLADTFKRLAESSNTAIIVTAHTTKGTNCSRGHLGSQFKDEVGLEIILCRKSSGQQTEQVVEVDFAKTRHSLPTNFMFRQTDYNLLIEVETTVDQTELRNSQKRALELFKKYLTPGKKYRYSDIIRILEDHGIVKSTATKYVNQAKGCTLQFDGKKYCLPDKALFNEEDDDLPED